MKFLKNKFVIGLFCLVLALVVVVMVMPKNTGKTVDVIKLNNTVDANTQITDNMVRKVTIPEDANVSGAITEKEKVVGKYTTTQIYKDDFIVDGKLSDTPTNSNLYALNNGEEAISITVKDLASCVTGKLIEGDVVSIYYYDTTEKKVVENPLLKYVEVLATSNSAGVDVSTAAMDENQDDNIPTTLTLKVNREQAEALTKMEYEGNIHVTFVARGEKAANYIQK